MAFEEIRAFVISCFNLIDPHGYISESGASGEGHITPSPCLDGILNWAALVFPIPKAFCGIVVESELFSHMPVLARLGLGSGGGI